MVDLLLRRKSMKTMPTGLILFFSVFFAIGFLILGIGLYSLRMSYLAKHWPTTEGKITVCEVKESKDSDSTTFEAIVKYGYVVAGRSYEGDRIAFGYSGSSLRSAHQEIADRLTGVKTVLVRYDPKDASRSVLTYGINRSTIILLVFGATWVLFVTGLTLLCSTITQSDYGILRTLVTTK